ncbi:imm11 family protein [Clostridium butyricum]|uniref:imm11 family protein n=1 Tax=Clostridium butyricum TaxID=1492 RepID=UPI0013D2E46D|nr:DUF1629 domain-containing protein [Clostridium butyricum]MCQ2017864.1 hypothetical protein [Clostridium butyricum]MCQ2022553.1 hypothetical protein [Clostridium butyricum]NFB71595.1 hypothetical protein [Clostridium butyricum]NFB92946.1 hypothetical protein [Clostridium butyricum]UTY55112.1 hypothetical protein HNS01_18520 [Clostridium butyricum]
MDYFLIEQDKRCTNVPQLTDINTNIERRYINRQDEGKIQNEMVLYVKSSEWNNYIDIMDKQLFIVSEEVKKVFEKYDEDIKFKMIAITDFERSVQHVYYLPIFEEVEGLSEKAEYGFNKMVINKIVLDYKKIREKKIFKLKESDKTAIICRLDVVESLLRRNFKGIAYKKLYIEKEEI